MKWKKKPPNIFKPLDCQRKSVKILKTKCKNGDTYTYISETHIPTRTGQTRSLINQKKISSTHNEKREKYGLYGKERKLFTQRKLIPTIGA